MGSIDIVPVVLGALAFFTIGVIWYGLVFRKVWNVAAGMSQMQASRRNMPLVFALMFAFELLISLTLAHQFAMSGLDGTPPSDRAKMMIAIGYGAMLMAPALGIVYLHLGKPGRLFAIDAGHFVAGMAAMGAVYCLFD